MIGAAASGGRRRGGVSDPTLIIDHDFTITTTLDPSFTFTSTAGGTYYDVSGVQQTASANQPRFDHDQTTHNPLGIRFDSAFGELAIRSITGTGFSTTEGTMVLDYMVNATAIGLGRSCMIDNGSADGTERLMAFYVATAPNLLGQYRPAGSTIYSATGSNGTNSVVQRIAMAYAAANGAVYQNGTAAAATAGTGASVTVPLSVTNLRLGNNIAGDRPFAGWVRRIRLYNVRKSNTDLAALTAIT